MNKLFLGAEVKSLKSGEFEVVASNAQIDRYGDTINPEGWVLSNYKKNPVMLWSHMSGGGLGETPIPPVARATKVWVEDGNLKAKGVFAPTPFAQELRTLVEDGFLNAVSVGFMPLVEDEKGAVEVEEKMYRRANEDEIEKGYSKDGTKFKKQELLEISWVSVPALPTALVSARKMGLQLITKELETKEIGKPYPNEHSCRLSDPDDYKTCKRTSRTSDGKKYSILTCQRKDDDTKWEEQGYRYAKDIWTASEAKKHCTDHKGIKFEPASEKEKTTYDCECIDCGHKMTSDEHCADIKCPKCGGEMRRAERPGPGRSDENIETKVGRVISEKNRKLINNCVKQMGEAIDALKVLLTATEPEKDIAPEVKGRSHSKMKGGINPELRLMLLANKAVENTLRKLKENKSGQKVEIRYLRIASKVVDAAIIKAKAKTKK